MTGAPRSSEILALTSLRAVAALLVLLYHFPPSGLGRVVEVVAAEGHVGVTVFFVLSGFLITVRYFPSFAAGGAGLADYFVRRAARILPLYYVVLTLSYAFTDGAAPIDRAHLPEWTLTHALFGSSLEGAAIPTAWSLTVEECFYATAPLVFLALAAARRRRTGAPGALAVIAGVSGLFVAAGALVHRWAASAGAPFPYLADAPAMWQYTIFGRFPDFAVGVAAGLWFLSGRVARAWARPGGTAWATVLTAAGAGLVLGAQFGMTREAAHPGRLWWLNVAVACGAGAIVLGLTCASTWPARLLSLRLPVYLGRISYAVYLIQLTPLGNDLFYRILPGQRGVHLVALYVGIGLVAALLFETVEEPARETILALWKGRTADAVAPPRSPRLRRASVGVLALAIAGQYAAWALASLDSVDHARVMSVLGANAPDVVTAAVMAPEEDGERDPRVRLPSTWRVGPAGDLRAPRSLLVFVDGRPVPFLGVRRPQSDERLAYYRRPRAEFLSVQVEPPAALTIVNHSAAVALALAWSRLRESPALLAAPLAALLAFAVLLWRRVPHAWPPYTSLALASLLIVGWLVTGLHMVTWAPVVLLIEVALLAGLAFGRGEATAADVRSV